MELLNKDFYHVSAATLEVKSKTANGVAFKVAGKSSHEKATAGALEAKYTDKPTGTAAPLLPPTISFPMRYSLSAAYL